MVPPQLAMEIRRVTWLRRLEQALYAFIVGNILLIIYFSLMPSGSTDFSIYAEPGVIVFGAVSTAIFVGSFAAAAIYAQRIFATSRVAAARRFSWVARLLMALLVVVQVAIFALLTFFAYHYTVGDMSTDALYAILAAMYIAGMAGVVIISVFYIFSSAMLYAESRAKLFIAAAVLFAIALIVDVATGGSAAYDGFGLAWLILVIAVRRYRRRLATELAVALRQQQP